MCCASYTVAMQMCAAGRFGSIAWAFRAASSARANWLLERCSLQSRACSAARTTVLSRCAIASPTAAAVPGLPLDTVNSAAMRSEEHTSELQSQSNLVCRLLLEKKKNTNHEPLRVLVVSESRPALA